MLPSELSDLFRSDVVDTVEPYLWSDQEVEFYGIAAQEMFVRLTGGIQDASSSLTQVTVTTGEKWSPYSDKILRVVSATLRSTGYPVAVLNPPDMDDTGKPWGPTSINLAGSVCAVILGMDDTQMRIVQVPEADDVIDLVIERLPYENPYEVGEFEIADQHHLYLLHWMKHLAYAKQDSETFDQVKSEREGVKFVDYCRAAKAEKDRRKNKPRLMVYGGIGGATSNTWTRGSSSW